MALWCVVQGCFDQNWISERREGKERFREILFRGTQIEKRKTLSSAAWAPVGRLQK